MYKHFVKPLRVIIIVYLVTGLGVLADIATLTNFNFVHFITINAPLSYYIILAGTVLLYIGFVINSFVCKENKKETHKSEPTTGQSITTRNVKNSTIIQIKNGKED